MKLLQPSFVIDDMPEGEAALAKIERLGRIAYKSEGKIDDGIRREACPECGGSDQRYQCSTCQGSGSVYKYVREPSSHKFVRMILKAERKAKMILMADKLLLEDSQESMYTTVAHDDLRKGLASKLVQSIIDYMEANPAHESVIEHCSASVILTTNRGVTHEGVRHRIASFTMESTRYCDYNGEKFGGEITFIDRTDWGKTPELDARKIGRIYDIWRHALEVCEVSYKALRAEGVPPEIARDLLPNALKADIAITANFREWRHFFRMRASDKAHPDMRRLMVPLRDEFRKRVPIIFD